MKFDEESIHFSISNTPCAAALAARLGDREAEDVVHLPAQRLQRARLAPSPVTRFIKGGAKSVADAVFGTKNV